MRTARLCPAFSMTSAQGYDTCQLENEVRKTCGAQSVPVAACAPALVTMVSTFSCRTICIIAIATPEWTGPVRMSTFSPAISLLTFAGAFAGSDSSSTATHSTSRPPNFPPCSCAASVIASVMLLPGAAYVREYGSNITNAMKLAAQEHGGKLGG